MKKIILLFGIILLLTQLVFTQIDRSSNHKQIEKRTNEVFDSLVKIRRDLHKYPEIAGMEKRTSKIIEEYLLNLGLEVKTNIGGYGVVGILKGGKKGRKIAWRADIDALKNDAPNKVSFKSQNEGIRHICGHDVHTAIGLGIANVLANQKESIEGTVYFIFQPAEETYEGVKAMIEDGLFDLIKPDEIYGLHVTPLPKGVIATKSEAVYAHTNQIKVSYKNSSKNESVINYTKKLISSLQNIKADSKFWDIRSLLDPNIGIGNPNTIYKNYLTV